MLVLSRKKGEAIRISDDIRIVVIEIRGDKVRYGIEAPQAVPVHREEVYQAIHQNDPKPAPIAPPAPLSSFMPGVSSQ